MSITLDVEWAEGGPELRASTPVPALPMMSWSPSTIRSVSDHHAWSALSDLWLDEKVDEATPGRYRLNGARLRDEDVGLLETLGIPSCRPARVRVRARGAPGQAGFTVVSELYDAEGNRLDGFVADDGRLLCLRAGGVALLNSEVAELRSLAASIGDSPDVGSRLRTFARIGGLGRAIGAELDPIWDREDVEYVDDVTIRPNATSADALDLEVDLQGEGGTTLTKEEVDQLATRTIVTRHSGGVRKRLVASPRVSEGLRDLKDRGTFRGADVPKFLSNPEAYLPEAFSLSDYSDRVIGVRVNVYNSRPYLHVRKSSGGWLEGVIEAEVHSLKDNEPSEHDRDRLRERVKGRLRKGKSSHDDDGEWVRDGNDWVRVSEGDQDFVERVTKAAADSGSEDGLVLPHQGVLDIHTNLEDLDYIRLAESVSPEDLARSTASQHAAPPRTFNGTLRPHQVDGYQWLIALDAGRMGGLLADDMGLGKTVQVAAHLARLKEEQRLDQALIVLPLTLMDNWEQELARFAPNLRVIKYEGSRAERAVRLRSDADVVLVSYDTMRRDQLTLARHDWSTVICDEAQFVKNPTAMRTSAVKALKSEHRVALTGTPVENGLIELWCILDFVQPGRMGSWKQFRNEYERPIIEAMGPERDTLVGRLQDSMGRHFLRRTKDEVLKDLPVRHPTSCPRVEMSAEQTSEYREIVTRAKEGGRGEILGAIQRLIRFCSDVPSGFRDAPIAERVRMCPKLRTTLEILDDVRGRSEKAIVFTRFIGLQDLLQDVILDRYGLRVERINGAVTGNRQAIVDKFQVVDDFNVLILSHDVAGVGLNITGANHVIHYTRPWNPAKENQATDRVHRIGQEREVWVHAPLSTALGFKTVDERLDELLREKADLARDVLVPRKELAITEHDLWESLE